MMPRGPVVRELLFRGLVTSFAALSALTSVACTSDNDSMGNDSISPAQNELVTLSAEVIRWDSRIGITYTITSNADENLVVFDGHYDENEDVLQIGGTGSEVWLLKGQTKADFNKVQFYRIPPVGGRLLMPGGMLTGLGTTYYPIVIGGAAGGTYRPDPVEFCVTYEIAAENVIGDNDYPSIIDIDAPQSLVCLMLARPE